MKLRMLSVALVAFFLAQFSIAQNSDDLFRREKVNTYVGLLRHLKLSNDESQNYFLFVSAKEVYRLQIPFHFRGVTFHNLDKRVEVKGVLVEKAEESQDGVPKVKVKNMVYRPERRHSR